MTGRERESGHADGFHQHQHAHAGQPAHRHPHHHAGVRVPAHAHAHPTSFESLTYIVSPVHDLDARAKIAASLLLVIGIVVTPPLRPVEFAGVVALLVATSAIARLPLRRLLARSLVVIPVAGTIALLAPLGLSGGSWSAGGGGAWMAAWGIVSKAWLSALSMLLLAATTTTPDLLRGLRRIGVPAVFVMLLSFIARYLTVLTDQLRTLRIALASRAPRLRRRVLLQALGSIAGNLFVRSYERGERVYAAMLSRGYTGALPPGARSRFGPADVLLLTTAAAAAGALALY